MLYVFFLSLFVYLNKRLIYLPVSWFKLNLRHGQLVPVNLFAVNCARLIVVESFLGMEVRPERQSRFAA